MSAYTRKLWCTAMTACASLVTSTALAQGLEFTQIQRGRYISKAADCISCHTVKGGKPYAGGYPVETPFGTIYSSNITPDLETGIGKWSKDDFYRAMHEGIRRDGEHIYPACPYPAFTKMTRADVDALKDYLDTLNPMRAQNPPNDLIWPLGWRTLLAGWNALFFHEGEYTPVDGKSDVWNRGAYLVQGAGHCAACHTPRNMLGASQGDHALQGGDAGESWYAPSLTGHTRDGLGRWSTQDIVEYLKTGANNDTASVGPMTEVVMNSTHHLTDADLQAIATYLKDIPPHQAGQDEPEAISDSIMTHGKALYVDQCMGCHMADGKGQKDAFPPLADSAPIQAAQPQTLIQVVLGGERMADPPLRPTGLGMPAFDWKLNDQDVADVLTYIRNAWGNQAPAVDAGQVHDVRQALQKYGPRYERLITQSSH